MKYIAINTKEVDIISGRDAIYLDLEQNNFKTKAVFAHGFCLFRFQAQIRVLV